MAVLLRKCWTDNRYGERKSEHFHNQHPACVCLAINHHPIIGEGASIVNIADDWRKCSEIRQEPAGDVPSRYGWRGRSRPPYQGARGREAGQDGAVRWVTDGVHDHNHTINSWASLPAATRPQCWAFSLSKHVAAQGGIAQIPVVRRWLGERFKSTFAVLPDQPGTCGEPQKAAVGATGRMHRSGYQYTRGGRHGSRYVPKYREEKAMCVTLARPGT